MSSISNDDLNILAELEKKMLWLASWTIHNANHIRENADGLKVGGHQASSASLATIMTALYFDVLRPQDRVAVKPHASPIFHAIQYLLGKQTAREARELPRLQGRAELSLAHQGHRRRRFLHRLGRPRRRADAVLLAGAGLRARAWLGEGRPEGRMIALVGDAELDEGNIFEALLEGWKHGLRNSWWVDRLQPPEPRRGGPRGPLGALRDDVHATSAGTW